MVYDHSVHHVGIYGRCLQHHFMHIAALHDEAQNIVDGAHLGAFHLRDSDLYAHYHSVSAVNLEVLSGTVSQPFAIHIHAKMA